jgi:hypothetical protein
VVPLVSQVTISSGNREHKFKMSSEKGKGDSVQRQFKLSCAIELQAKYLFSEIRK